MKGLSYLMEETVLHQDFDQIWQEHQFIVNVINVKQNGLAAICIESSCHPVMLQSKEGEKAYINLICTSTQRDLVRITRTARDMVLLM